MSEQLEKFSGFKHDLAIAETIEEIKQLENKTAAVSEFIKRDRVGKKEQNQWGEFRVEIERKKGAWLDEFFPSKVKKEDRSSRTTQDDEKRSFLPTQNDKMPVKANESSQARLINNEPKFVKEAIKEIKKDKKNIITPAAVTTIVRKKVKKEKEKDPKYLKKEEQKKTSRYFANTNSALNKALDRVTFIVQGDYIPQTKKDFAHIVGIKNNLYTAIRLSIQAGIDVPKVWETYKSQVKIADHLDAPVNDSIEEATVIQ